MELLVLGSSASCPGPGDACSGYLVRQGETQLLIDCGSGVLSRLLVVTSLGELSAIVVSHFHPDHFIDLVTMRYGLRYGSERVARPRLLVPPGGADYLRGLGAALRGSPGFFDDSFRIEEYDPSQPSSVESLTLTFQRTTHDVPTWAIAVAGAARLVYSADTRECADLKVLAAGADLFLCESTYPAEGGRWPRDNHLTSIDAGHLARAAGARNLVLTHFWPDIPRDRFRREAEDAYGGPVTLARPGLRLAVAKSSASAQRELVERNGGLRNAGSA